MKKLTWSTCLLFVFLFVCSSNPATAGDVNISWPTFQGNAAHTGYVPISLDPKGFESNWEVTLEAGVPLNPVTAADGKVFVSVDASIMKGIQGPLFALDADGTELWMNDFGSVGTLNPPSYAGGNVYIQTVGFTGTGSLCAFKASDGSPAFEPVEFGAQWIHGYYAPTIYDGILYMNGGYQGGMWAYNTYDGSKIQETIPLQLPQYDEWTPAVNDDYVFAYVGTTLYAMARDDITQISFSVDGPDFVPTDFSMRLAPVIGEQNDILVIQGGRLISFDVQEKAIRWVVEMVDGVQSNFNGQPSVANGVVYAINYGVLTAWDEETGGFLWSWQAPESYVTGSMIVTDTHVLVGTESATYAIDLETHADIWSYEAAGHLAIGNDSLYIASSNGWLTAISVATAAAPNEPPNADAGPDQVGWGEFMLDGSNSYDPDGQIVSYMWEVKPRDDGETKRINITLEGVSLTLSDLEPGFYDVVLTVTDNDGNSAEDMMLLAVAGQCEGSPQPNAAFNVNSFKIMKYKGWQKKWHKKWYKKWKWATVSMNGKIDLPDLDLPYKGNVESEITIKLLGVLPDGNDLVVSQEKKLRVKNNRRYLHIYK